MKCRIYTLPECRIDSIIKNYSQHIFEQYKTKITINSIRPQYLALIHILRSRDVSTKDDWFTLNSRLLQSLFPKYRDMLWILEYMGYVHISKTKNISNNFFRCYYSIPENEEFELKEIHNKKVFDYLEKHKKQLSDYSKKQIEQIKKIHTNSFLDSYRRNLQRLSLNNLIGLDIYMNENNPLWSAKKVKSQEYWYRIKEQIQNKESLDNISMDENGRFYHILTRTPRDMRQFLNLNYSIDCNNSQPLFLSYFILSYYLFDNYIDVKFDTINNNILAIINSYIYSNYNNKHSFKKNLCIQLVDSGLGGCVVDRIGLIPQNVFKYIYYCQTGQFWNILISKYKEKHKDSIIDNITIKKDVKESVFREVLFAKKQGKNLKIRDVFKSLFPDVYKVILKIRRTLNELSKAKFKENSQKIKTENDILQGVLDKMYEENMAEHQYLIQLPHLLTKLESTIFTEILKKLYGSNMRIKAVGLHDAIYILDSYKKEDLKDLCTSVFNKYGLYPTFSVE